MTNHNKIINFSESLLNIAAELSVNNMILTQNFMENLHIHLLNELKLFKLNLKKAGFNQIELAASSYCLSSYLDEIIMNSANCLDYDWSKNTLVSIIHNETWGGENFYLIFDYVSQKSTHYKELFEFIYLLISLGYKGKFYSNSNARNSVLKNLKPDFLAKNYNSDHYQITVSPKPKTCIKTVKKLLQLFLLVMLIFILIMVAYYDYKLKENTRPTLKEIITTLGSIHEK